MAEPERCLPPSHQSALPLRWIEAARVDTPSVSGGTPAPLPGYLCEACLDAPALAVVPAPWGEAMGLCQACQQRQAATKDAEA
jgi:hypothetical protein